MIFEIRAGAGGEDARNFVSDLFQMYSRYAKNGGLSLEVLEKKESQPGLRQVSFKLSGQPNKIKKLLSEGGAHRLQHKTSSRKKDQIHTSTATVAVLPVQQAKEIRIPDSELRWETIRGSGPGGQHRNKTESMVRLTHIPTGLQASIDGRSQTQNRELALTLLFARLQSRQQEEQTSEYQNLRASQTKAERARAVRTYNLITDTVRDASGKKVKRAKKILQGKLDLLFG